MATTTAVLETKVALDAAIRVALTAAGLNPDGRIVIDWGYPSTSADDMVLLMDSKSVQEWRTSNRGRNEAATLAVHFLTRRSTQQEADAAAFSYLEAVDRHCRIGNPSLGNVVEECVLTATECNGYTDPANRTAGRFCELIATFTTRAKITG